MFRESFGMIKLFSEHRVLASCPCFTGEGVSKLDHLTEMLDSLLISGHAEENIRNT